MWGSLAGRESLPGLYTYPWICSSTGWGEQRSLGPGLQGCGAACWAAPPLQGQKHPCGYRWVLLCNEVLALPWLGDETSREN